MDLSLTSVLWPSILKLAAAFMVGLLIGFERRWHFHEGALHTSLLVCLGSAIFVVASGLVMENQLSDRTVAQIASGIGFLGAGAILRDGLRVRGLATAATFWCTAAVGALCGLGYFSEAFCACAFIVLANGTMHWLDKKIPWPKQTSSYDDPD